MAKHTGMPINISMKNRPNTSVILSILLAIEGCLRGLEKLFAASGALGIFIAVADLLPDL